MPEPDAYLRAARASASKGAFYQRLNDLADEHKAARSESQHQSKVAALWSTMQQLSYDPKDLSAANPISGRDTAGRFRAHGVCCMRLLAMCDRRLHHAVVSVLDTHVGGRLCLRWSRWWWWWWWWNRQAACGRAQAQREVHIHVSGTWWCLSNVPGQQPWEHQTPRKDEGAARRETRQDSLRTPEAHPGTPSLVQYIWHAGSVLFCLVLSCSVLFCLVLF